jgi:hypothetical protein
MPLVNSQSQSSPSTWIEGLTVMEPLRHSITLNQAGQSRAL